MTWLQTLSQGHQLLRWVLVAASMVLKEPGCGLHGARTAGPEAARHGVSSRWLDRGGPGLRVGETMCTVAAVGPACEGPGCEGLEAGQQGRESVLLRFP